MQDDRYAQAVAFAAKHDWPDPVPKMVAGDASNRKYYRLHDQGDTAILMDAPPEKGEDTTPFVNMAIYLEGAGLSAPNIMAMDEKAGFLLIEDFGDDLFARLLEADPSMETTLYEAATDVLLHLHKSRTPQLAAYDAVTMADLAALAVTWYRNGTTGEASDDLAATLKTQMQQLLSPLDDAPRVVIQRDYHAENLLWLPDRKGVRRVGLLDFQDAMLGHPAYDLVSVLQDARRDVSGDVAKAMLARYLEASQLDADVFRHAYYALGLQRNLRILGVFARLCLRDGKAHYVDLIPRVWGHILTNLDHLGPSDLTKFIHDTLPVPTDEVLQSLKAKCPTP